jgi:AAA+ superfamily predicted ATPase
VDDRPPLDPLLDQLVAVARASTTPDNSSEPFAAALAAALAPAFLREPAVLARRLGSARLTEVEAALFGLLVAAALSPDVLLDAAAARAARAPRGARLSFLLGLAAARLGARAEVLQALASGERLRALGFVEVAVEGPEGLIQDPYVFVPWRVIFALLGVVDLSPGVAAHARLEVGQQGVFDVPLTESVRSTVLATFGARPGVSVPPFAFALVGAPGSGRRTLARVIATHLGRPACVVRGASLLALDSAGRTHVLREATADCRLLGAVLIVTDASRLLALPELLALAASLLGLGCPHPSLLLLDAGDEARIPDFALGALTLEPPGRTERAQLWEHLFPDDFEAGPDLDLDLLAAGHELSPRAITNAMALAAVQANVRGSNRLSAADLESAAALQQAGGASRFVRVKRSRRGLDALVVPPDVRQRLDFFVAAARGRVDLLARWGFDDVLVSGRGLTALFTGKPGTGKTFAAELIAGELGLELWHVDLSGLVSKYVGETEKNIHSVFAATRARSVVLLLDEADALFGSRVEVKSATDKYANLEVNALLQELDAFEGVMILTSNLPENVDEAFRRRLLVQVDFPMPDADLRAELWRGLIPEEAPLSADVDFAKLARAFELTGGYIRNAAVCAAYAGLEGGNIRMADLERFAIEQSRAAGKLVRI